MLVRFVLTCALLGTFCTTALAQPPGVVKSQTIYTLADGRRVVVEEWSSLPAQASAPRPIVATAPAPPPVVLPAYPSAPVYYPPVTYVPQMPARSVPASGPFVVSSHTTQTTTATAVAPPNTWSNASTRTAPIPTAAPGAATRGATARPLFGVGGGIYGPFGGGIRGEACIGGKP